MYAAEQGDDGMDQDLIPWLEREWRVDLALSEFPYFQYDAPEDNPAVREWMDTGFTDPWTLPDHIRESATFRTDIVAVRLDRGAVRDRRSILGHDEVMITSEGWGSPQPRLRTWLNFKRDGPMTREYYVHDHGLFGEPNAMAERDSVRTFEWLKDHRFLTDTPGVDGWKPVGIGPVFGRNGLVAAIELKREPGEWRTALEQAARADVYADVRYVAMSEPTADRALAHADRFRDEGVGLMTVSTSGVTVHVDAARCPPTEDHDLLSRPYCERWDLNERVFRRVVDGGD